MTFAADVDLAATSIEQRTTDAAVRRNALLWRLRAVPEMRKACFRPGPISGLVDAWTLAHQMDQLFTTGAGAASPHRTADSIEGLPHVDTTPDIESARSAARRRQGVQLRAAAAGGIPGARRPRGRPPTPATPRSRAGRRSVVRRTAGGHALRRALVGHRRGQRRPFVRRHPRDAARTSSAIGSSTRCWRAGASAQSAQARAYRERAASDEDARGSPCWSSTWCRR